MVKDYMGSHEFYALSSVPHNLQRSRVGMFTVLLLLFSSLVYIRRLQKREILSELRKQGESVQEKTT